MDFQMPIWGASLPAGPVPSKLNLVPTKSRSADPEYGALDLFKAPAVVIWSLPQAPGEPLGTPMAPPFAADRHRGNSQMANTQ